jgi:hypothetical protein
MWIDHDYYGSVLGEGATGYLTRILDTSTGSERYLLHTSPERKNRSGEPVLNGWAGETNNRSRTAVGVWTVVRFNLSRERALIERVTGPTLAAFLEGDGYPELVTSAA